MSGSADGAGPSRAKRSSMVCRRSNPFTRLPAIIRSKGGKAHLTEWASPSAPVLVTATATRAGQLAGGRLVPTRSTPWSLWTARRLGVAVPLAAARHLLVPRQHVPPRRQRLQAAWLVPPSGVIGGGRTRVHRVATLPSALWFGSRSPCPGDLRTPNGYREASYDPTSCRAPRPCHNRCSRLRIVDLPPGIDQLQQRRRIQQERRHGSLSAHASAERDGQGDPAS